jgi:hypothetical protein
MERVSVSLNTPKPTMKGKGDAIHNWNKDQAAATPSRTFRGMPPGDRAPVSASATRSCSSSSDIADFLSTCSLIKVPFTRQRARVGGGSMAWETNTSHRPGKDDTAFASLPLAYSQPFSR